MKVLHINTLDRGGAGKACVRFHTGLLRQGIDSNLLLLYQDDRSLKNTFCFYDFFKAKKKPLLIRAIRKIRHTLFPEKTHLDHLENCPEGYESFTSVKTQYDITQHFLFKEADIIHLHWVGDFLDFKSFFRNVKGKKIVWTMQDMNPMTGGCHYSSGCDRFKTDCHNCPQLQGTIDTDYAQKNLRLKKKSVLKAESLHLVCSSNWLKSLSEKSYLFADYPHSMIFNGTDTELYFPADKKKTKEKWGLPEDKTVFLFIAYLKNKRKGYYYVREAFKKLEMRTDIFLCVAGDADGVLTDIPNSKFIGPIYDEQTLSAYYSAGDALIFPSLEDDLPNTIIESFLCGVPVIGFPVGGIPEMIVEEENGCLCVEIGVVPLITAIEKFIVTQSIFDEKIIRNNALEKYSMRTQAENYMELYKDLIGNQ